MPAQPRALRPSPPTGPLTKRVPSPSVLSAVARGAVAGAVSAVLFTFPFAALLTATFRFPVPFAGYRSGVEAIPSALVGLLFYGLIGGFVVVAFFGAMGGALAYWRLRSRGASAFHAMLALSAATAFAGTLLLAILDKLIGPW